MTNREWLHQMSDEQLAEWLNSVGETFIHLWYDPSFELPYKDLAIKVHVKMLQAEHEATEVWRRRYLNDRGRNN